MRKHRPNHMLVKIHRTYSVDDAARLFGLNKNAIRAWVKAGLPVCDDARPMLILGRDLFDFLKARRTKNKRTCDPGEIYCVRCRTPKAPAGAMAEYRSTASSHGNAASLGNLVGICPDCEGRMFRRVNRAKLPQAQGELVISFPTDNIGENLSRPTGQKGPIREA
jgi:hypothetical protein